MSSQMVFHLIMLSLIGACFLGCILAGIAELLQSDNGYLLNKMARETRRKRKRIAQRRAKLNAIRYSR